MGSQFKVTAHQGRAGRAGRQGRQAGQAWQQELKSMVRKQSDEHWCSALFLLLFNLEPQAV